MSPFNSNNATKPELMNHTLFLASIDDIWELGKHSFPYGSENLVELTHFHLIKNIWWQIKAYFTKSEIIQIDVSDEVLGVLMDISAKTNQPINQIVTDLLKGYLRKEEKQRWFESNMRNLSDASINKYKDEDIV